MLLLTRGTATRIRHCLLSILGNLFVAVDAISCSFSEKPRPDPPYPPEALALFQFLRLVDYIHHSHLSDFCPIVQGWGGPE